MDLEQADRQRAGDKPAHTHGQNTQRQAGQAAVAMQLSTAKPATAPRRWPDLKSAS